jgi:hypothetical protein
LWIPESSGEKMNDAEHAPENRERIHHIAPVWVWMALTALLIYKHGVHGIRPAGLLGLAVACIRWPDIMGKIRSIGGLESRPIDEPSHPVFLRWAGWFLLLSPLWAWAFGWLIRQS